MSTPPNVPPYRDEDVVPDRAPQRDMSPRAPVPESGVGPAPAGDVLALRDRVRWGPIWAGLIATSAVFLLLVLLMVGVGLLTPGAPGVSATPGATSAVVTVIIGVIAFFVGGWVVGATSAIRGAMAGILNSLLMWGLWVALLLLLTGFGRVIMASIAPPAAAGPAAAITPSMAWVTLASLVLAALAAALGGWLGSLRGALTAASPMRWRGRAPSTRTTAPA
jgi:hypothetical protein